MHDGDPQASAPSASAVDGCGSGENGRGEIGVLLCSKWAQSRIIQPLNIALESLWSFVEQFFRHL